MGDKRIGLVDAPPEPLPTPAMGERCSGVSCCGGGELADCTEPTEPGSLKPPCVLLSSGLSKKHKLNSEPASKDTSGVIFSGDGALPRLLFSDWSILNTSMFMFRSREDGTPPGRALDAALGAATHGHVFRRCHSLERHQEVLDVVGIAVIALEVE